MPRVRVAGRGREHYNVDMAATAPADLPIRCACGAVRGVLREVSPERGTRAMCYCDDCQSFAHFLERAEEILDAHGGTEVFQTSPARLEISSGADRLACMQLTTKGLFRWYTSCCRTPIGNTLSTGRLPFVGLIHSCVAADAARREAVLGPIRARVFGRFAKGDVSTLDVHARAPLGLMARAARLLIGARLRGDHKRSPFFDARSGAPVAVPHVLTDEERRRVEQTRDAAA